MKLNKECVRDLLLYLEENLSINDFVAVENITLKPYSYDDLFYTASKLSEANYINCSKRSFDDETYIYISSITYQGHQFLDNVRDDNVWKKTKAILNPLKSISIELISETASKVIIHFINQQLGNT